MKLPAALRLRICLLLPALCFSLLLPAQRKRSAPFANSQFIGVQGLRLHLRIWVPQDSIRGQVLLIHGFSGSTFTWRYTAEALAAAGQLVVAADLPPFGYSDRAPRLNHSHSARADLLWALLDSLNPEAGSWVLAGHSMGAGVAGAMAVRRPAQTRAVVFADGTLPDGERRAAWHIRLLAGNGLSRGAADLAGKVWFFHPRQIRKLLRSAYSAEPGEDAVQGYLQPLKLPHTAAGIFDMTAHSRPVFEFSPALVQAPALILWGEADGWIPLETGRAFHAKRPEWPMHVLPGAGHCPMETHPEAFSRHLLDFLASLPGQ
ncbi:MAG: alpha/beta hydrolase [Bacteroidia bacterium]|nr:alpha/beta hydrolase [Bacteroidia bacterium]